MVVVKNLLPACLLSLAMATPAFAQDVAFTLVNDSSATLVEFYASPVDVDSWEEDILGADVLEAGYTGQVLIADGSTICEYDMRFVFDDGVEQEDTLDICTLASYTIE